MKRAGMAAVAAAVLVSLVAPHASAQTANEDFLFGLINTKRDAKGLPMLREHAGILAEAREHSEDMADRNQMGHFGFNGRVRRIRAGDPGINGYICENVAYARGYASDEQALRVIFDGWRRSLPHRKCMFDRNGHRTRSAAVGLEKRGATWWATFITAQDATP